MDSGTVRVQSVFVKRPDKGIRTLPAFHSFVNSIINSFLISVRTRSHANTSHKYQVKCDVQVKMNVLCNSYFIRAVHHWNLLPDECREIPTSAQFRSAVIDHLWSLVKKRCNELKNDTNPIEREPD